MRIFESKALILYCLLVVVSFFYFLPNVFKPPNLYDEGQILYGAVRVLNRQIPYRDFWTLYGPGQFYLLALVFKVFGVTIVVSRIYDIVIRSLLGLVIYLLAVKLTTIKKALLTWILAVLWLKFTGFFNYPIYPALLFCFTSIYLFEFYFSKKTCLFLVLAGILGGIASLFRYEFGIYTISAEYISLISFLLLSIKNKGKIFNILLIDSLYFFMGFLLPILPVVITLFKKVALNDLIYFFYLHPVQIYPPTRHLDFPVPNFHLLTTLDAKYIPLLFFDILNILPFYIPVITFGYFFTVILKELIIKKQYYRIKIWLVLILSLSGLFLSNAVYIRPDMIHLFPTLIFAILLITTYSGLLGNLFEINGKKILPIFVNAFIIILFLPPLLTFQVDFNLNTSISNSGITRAENIAIDPNQYSAIKYIQNHVPKDEYIFVGNLRHDKIIYNDVMFYFLSERNNASKFDQLVPGDATTLKTQKTIADDILRRNVNYIVLYTGFEEARDRENNIIVNAGSGVTYLDDFIASNFHLEQSYDTYFIYKRNNEGFGQG